MEDTAFVKDETPYLVFTCNKCRQYSYVKTAQKTKKCLRCGRTHQVKNLLGLGEVVNGMTAAVETVKQKQSEFLVPEFRSEGDFAVATGKSQKKVSLEKNIEKNKDCDIDLDLGSKFEQLFIEVLLELSKLHGKFPKYMLEIMADNSGIPTSELRLLIQSFKKKGVITVLKNENYYYQIIYPELKKNFK